MIKRLLLALLIGLSSMAAYSDVPYIGIPVLKYEDSTGRATGVFYSERCLNLSALNEKLKFGPGTPWRWGIVTSKATGEAKAGCWVIVAPPNQDPFVVFGLVTGYAFKIYFKELTEVEPR